MRKVTLALLLLAAALVPAAEAQQSHTYQLGTKQVAIPPPSGFAEGMSQSDHVATIMTSTESPNNEVLASHITLEDLARIKRGEQPEFSFYTKVSVLKAAKAREMTDADFAALVKQFESTSPQVFDVNGPVMKGAIKHIQGGLSEAAGKDVKVELGQPQNLGSFEKTKDVFSTILLLTVKGEGRELPLLGTLSFVNLKGRLVFFYTYRKFNSEKDAELLRDFTRGWLKEVVAANRP